MNSTRPACAIDPRSFGRRHVVHSSEDRRDLKSGLAEDLQLFGTTFAAGFLFVFLLIA